MSDPGSVGTIRATRQAAALLDPTRLRLLAELVTPEGASAASLAQRVGIKRQLVNYHLKELEDAGLVEVVAQRKRGSVTERVVRATARSFILDPALLGPLCPGSSAEPTPAGVAAAASAFLAEALAHGSAAPAPANSPVLCQRTALRFASADDRRAFIEDLAFEVGKLIAEYADPEPAGQRSGDAGGTGLTLFLAGFAPDPA